MTVFSVFIEFSILIESQPRHQALIGTATIQMNQLVQFHTPKSSKEIFLNAMIDPTINHVVVTDNGITVSVGGLVIICQSNFLEFIEADSVRNGSWMLKFWSVGEVVTLTNTTTKLLVAIEKTH